MKKFITSILVAAICLSMATCFSSCSKEDSGSASSTDDTTNETTQVSEPEAEEQEEEDNTPAPEFRYDNKTGKIELSYDNGETWIVLGSSNELDPSVSSLSYPVSTITKLPGTIADKTNKYVKAENNTGGYHGGLIDLANIEYSHVQLVRNDNGNEMGYAFLAKNLVLDSNPVYADGYSHCVWDDSKSVILEIPANAKYLYVYYNSNANIHLPSAVNFFSSYSDPMKNEDADKYVYPLEKIDVLDCYVDESNFLKSSTQKNGAIINLDGTVFNTVTLRKNVNSSSIVYAFMSDELHTDYTPCYATGYTDLVTSNEDSVTVRIPDNARYLYVYCKNGSDILIPSVIKFSKKTYEAENTSSVRIATWNIGHFSLGKKPDSTIENTQFAMKSEEYRDYINNAVNADVIFLNEYSQKFTKSANLAKNTVFDSYDKTVYEGPQLNYSCNAVYSKVEISAPERHEFECNKTAGTISTKVKATDYYFVTTDIVIDGTVVKLVSVHLAFDGEGSKNVVVNQLKELIAYCEQFEHVVLLGDWNINTFSEFNIFTNAGYSLGNADKDMPTYTSGSSLDNIVYKGVTVTDFTLAGTNLSDHYALYCTITVND